MQERIKPRGKTRRKIFFPERRRIEELLDKGLNLKEISVEMDIPYTAVCHEVMDNGGIRGYKAEEAQFRQ